MKVYKPNYFPFILKRQVQQHGMETHELESATKGKAKYFKLIICLICPWFFCKTPKILIYEDIVNNPTKSQTQDYYKF